jgi:hypothetical protein
LLPAHDDDACTAREALAVQISPGRTLRCSI